MTSVAAVGALILTVDRSADAAQAEPSAVVEYEVVTVPADGLGASDDGVAYVTTPAAADQR